MASLEVILGRRPAPMSAGATQRLTAPNVRTRSTATSAMFSIFEPQTGLSQPGVRRQKSHVVVEDGRVIGFYALDVMKERSAAPA
jgi:hypothetical protein